MKKIFYRSGLTLLELSVAVALAVGIVGTSAVFFGRSMRAWRRTEDRLEHLFVIEKGFQSLAVDLRNGVVLSDQPFQGSAQEMAFSSSPKPDALVHIRYALQTLGDSQVLIRESQSVPLPPNKVDAVTAKVFPHLRSFALEYAYRPTEGSAQIQWRGVWQGQEGLPKLIRVHVETEDLRGGVLSDSRDLLIPSGVLGKPAQ